MKPPIISREKVESAVPLEDCGGRKYPDWEREDIIRYMLFAAEIQRDRDIEYYQSQSNINLSVVQRREGGN